MVTTRTRRDLDKHHRQLSGSSDSERCPVDNHFHVLVSPKLLVRWRFGYVPVVLV